MSTENIAAFQVQVAASPELQSRLAEIQRQAATTTAETIARLATETGTPFTAAEFLACSDSSSGELKDSELETIAGGKTETIVSKEPAADSFGNLWGLLGANYAYTTDGKTHFVTRRQYEVGQVRNFAVLATSKKP